MRNHGAIHYFLDASKDSYKYFIEITIVLSIFFLKKRASMLTRRGFVKSGLLAISSITTIKRIYAEEKTKTIDEAYALQTEAEALLSHKEYDSVSYEILSLVNNSKCSAYDCEFVALAKQLNVNLVTTDRQILKQFSRVAISLKEALR